MKRAKVTVKNMDAVGSDVDLHIMSGDIPEGYLERLQQLRGLLIVDCKEYKEHEHIREFCTNAIMHHFLIARKYDLHKSYKLLCTALEWRTKRNPNQWFRSNMPPQEMSAHEDEAQTGKIQLCGRDRFDREIIVFDNSVQNTTGADGQLNFLAWNLELAIHTMPDHVDKYVVFMHLGNFSIFNSPPLQTTKETILMLTSCYPERLGHCICYQPPSYFFHIFNMMKALGLIDKRTLKKVLFILGDVSDGSENDKLLSSIIGRKWKALTNATSKVLSPGCSPGFVHEEYWPWLMQRWEQVNFRLFQHEDFDSSKLDQLSTKITADNGDDQHSDEGKWDTNVDFSVGTDPAIRDQSVIVRVTNRFLRRIMRPVVSRSLLGIQELRKFLEWADDVGNKPIYGTITTYVAIGFATLVFVIGVTIKIFYSTILGVINVALGTLDHLVTFAHCATDRSGICQSEFFVIHVMQFIHISLQLVPYAVTPVMFVFFVQMFNEQSHSVESLLDGLERTLERSGRKARHTLKTLKKHAERMGTEADLTFESLSHLSLANLSAQQSAEFEDDDASSSDADDEGDEDNLILFEGKLLRGRTARKARESIAHQKALNTYSRELEIRFTVESKTASGNCFSSPQKSSSSKSYFSGSRSKTVDGNILTPVASDSNLGILSNEHEDEEPFIIRSAPPTVKRTPPRPSYSDLPHEDRPLDLDDMEDDPLHLRDL